MSPKSQLAQQLPEETPPEQALPKESVLQQFEAILKRATEKKASDIHIKVGLPPIVRVNGHLYYLSDE